VDNLPSPSLACVDGKPLKDGDAAAAYCKLDATLLRAARPVVLGGERFPPSNVDDRLLRPRRDSFGMPPAELVTGERQLVRVYRTPQRVHKRASEAPVPCLSCFLSPQLHPYSTLPHHHEISPSAAALDMPLVI